MIDWGELGQAIVTAWVAIAVWEGLKWWERERKKK